MKRASAMVVLPENNGVDNLHWYSPVVTVAATRDRLVWVTKEKYHI
jgi:hypothetical protein